MILILRLMVLFYHKALCDHPLPALANNWTCVAACRHTTTPVGHTRPLPGISYSAEGRRLSLPEYTVLATCK